MPFPISHCPYINQVYQTHMPVTVSKFKGLRPVLEGFVVTMHEGACETESQIPRALARGILLTPEGFDVLFAQARVFCDSKPRQVGLNHDYNMTFPISPREC